MKGETKVRPGAYFRVEKAGTDAVAGADDGVVCAIFAADFGPLGAAKTLTGTDNYQNFYGNGGNTDMLREIYAASPKKVICIRLGDGGTAAKAEVAAATGTVTLTAKYAGSKKFTYSVKTKAADSTKKTVAIYADGSVFESHDFAVGDNEVDEFVAAFKDSENFAASKGTATGKITETTSTAFTAGEDPKITNADYSNAFSIAEKFRFNGICVDSNDNAVHLLLSAFLDRIYNVGQMAVCFVAQDPSETLADREAAAAAFNSEKVHYVLNAHVKESEAELKGYLLAARITAEYAVTPSSQSMTHKVISGWTELLEPLTPTQMTEAETKGCLVLSTNAAGQVWIDYAINTLVTPKDDQDAGWKKTRRTKTRFELMTRCNDQADSMIGKVNNDANGRATVVAQLQTIVNSMISEGKLVAGTVSEDTNSVSDGDYAYFVIDVVDLDSIEHVYLTYRFRFSSIV